MINFKVRHMVGYSFALVLSLGLSLSSTHAQGLFAMEEATPYASVRGWDVLRFHDKFTGDRGCRANKTEAGNTLVLRYAQDSGGRQAARWTVGTNTSQTVPVGGGILGIDKADIDAQFSFRDGWATMTLTEAAMEGIRAGSQLTFEVDGDLPRYLSLIGSAAAALKVQECFNVKASQSIAQSAGTPVATPQQSAQPDDVSYGTFEMCDFSGIKSTDGAATTIVFEAASGLQSAVEVLWIDQAGKSQTYGMLQPGQSVTLQTFVGHQWVGKKGGSCSYAVIYDGLKRVVFDYD